MAPYIYIFMVIKIVVSLSGSRARNISLISYDIVSQLRIPKISRECLSYVLPGCLFTYVVNK